MTTPEEAAEQQLRQAIADYNDAPARALEARNEEIRAAAEAGLKQVDIVRITGYTRETVRRALKPDVAARIKTARELADAERAASAVTKPHPWPRGAVVVALDNHEATFTPAAGPTPADAALEAPRRAPTEADAAAVIAGMADTPYAVLCRAAKAKAGSLDYEVYHPVMVGIVLADMQAQAAKR